MDLPAPPREPEPIVHPRKLAEDFPSLTVIHLGQDLVYIEDEDRSITVSQWLGTLGARPPGVVACQYAGRLLEAAHRSWHDHPRWQFKVAPVEETVTDDTQSVRTIVSFFGFAGKVKGMKHEANRYWQLLDPLQFGRTNLRELAMESENQIAATYRWADEVRTFCREMGLKPSTTRGGIAKQLLRDPRFYPRSRVKVPKATNDRTREHLPGNHYELKAERGGRLYSAIHLDQLSSHHTIAGDIPLPAADQLRAQGHFRSLMDVPWCKPNTPRWDRVMREHGLLYARIQITYGGPTEFLPPWAHRLGDTGKSHRERLGPDEVAARKRGERLVYLWTNELRLLERYRAKILYVIAAWTSPNVDTGIRDYAKWAREYLEKQPASVRRWLKPTLLTLYGMLATRPRAPVAGWWRAAKAKETKLPIGNSLIPVQLRQAKKEGEPSTNNVLQRGMIEAEMRARSLELASELETQGHEVLCIYADAVMVSPPPSGKPLPLMPGYWRPKGSLSLLRFLDETHFTAREMVRLPGIRRDSPVRLSLSDRRGRLHGDESTNPGGLHHGHVRHRPRQAVDGELLGGRSLPAGRGPARASPSD